VSKLSQAAAHPRRGTKHYPKWNFLQGMIDMLHNKRRKSKGENCCYFRILLQETLQEEGTIFHWSFSICHLSFFPEAGGLQMTNGKWKMTNGK
jgi:hypothetical protein